MEPRRCNFCREQNLECTGDEPACRRCVSGGKQSECFYPVPPATKRRTKLARRRACEPCKRKKRKCDGVRPQCGTCEASGSTCAWDKSHQRPSGKLRKIKPLEPGPSDSGEMQQSQHNIPVASTSSLPPPTLTGYSTAECNAITSDLSWMTYPEQPTEVPLMPLSDQYLQAGFMDPSFFSLPDVPSSDLDPNFCWTFYVQETQLGIILSRGISGDGSEGHFKNSVC